MVSRDNQLAHIRYKSRRQISGRLAGEPFSAARFIIARPGNKDGVMKPKRHLHGIIGSQHESGLIVGGKTNRDMTAVMITTECSTVVSAQCLKNLGRLPASSGAGPESAKPILLHDTQDACGEEGGECSRLSASNA